MAQTSFNVDKEMNEALDELKRVFGVSSNAAVLKRAVAYARASAKVADKDNNVVLLRPDGKEVVLPLRF